MKISFKSIVLLGLCIVSQGANACYSPNLDLTIPIEELLKRSPQIFRVHVLKKLKDARHYPVLLPIPKEVIGLADGVEVEYPGWEPFLVNVQEYLKGEGPEEGVIYGFTPPTQKQFNDSANIRKEMKYAPSPLSYSELVTKLNFDFFHHTLQDFWQASSGRTQQESTCNAHPVYIKNNSYLIFSGKQHVKGYEVVNHSHDRWLSLVKKMLSPK